MTSSTPSTGDGVVPQRPDPSDTGPAPAHLVAVPSPAQVAARCRPLHTTPSPGGPAVVDGVSFTGHAVESADRHGLDLQLLAAAVHEPERTWLSLHGDCTVHLRGPVAVLVSADTGDVVGVSDRDRALRLRSQPRHGSVRRAKGGVGNRFPTDTADMLSRARRKGLEVIEDRDHYVLRRPGHPGQVAAARTPSDHRALPNTVLEIRRTLDVDLRTA